MWRIFKSVALSSTYYSPVASRTIRTVSRSKSVTALTLKCTVQFNLYLRNALAPYSRRETFRGNQIPPIVFGIFWGAEIYQNANNNSRTVKNKKLVIFVLESQFLGLKIKFNM